jgi:Zn-dependent protease
MDWRIGLYFLPGLIIGLTVHESAHALSAKWLGDRNPERMGRISLNPFRHLSPLGTAALFFLGFGWGKPVVVNLYNFRRPKLYYLLSSLAGPASNLLLCLIAAAVLHVTPGSDWPYKSVVIVLCLSVFYINGILAAINLLPVPPLDGSKIWPCVIPGMRPTVSRKWGRIWIVVLLAALFTGGIDWFIRGAMGLLSLLLPTAS